MSTYEEYKCFDCNKIFIGRKFPAKKRFCSKICRDRGLRVARSEWLRKQQLKRKRQKITDEKMLEVWNQYLILKGSKSLEYLFREYGYSVRPEKLVRLVGRVEYKKAIKQYEKGAKVLDGSYI